MPLTFGTTPINAKTHFISHALIFITFPRWIKRLKGERWGERCPKGESNCSHKAKNVLLCNLGTEHLFLFGSVKIYAWNYWITDTLIVLNSIPAVISLLFFSKRKGGKDILRFPIKGDDSVNRVNNSVVELSGKYSLSMIVDKTWSLQMGVANRSSEELETSFFISLLMASDSGEDTGISLNDRNVLIIGFLSGKNDRV